MVNIINVRTSDIVHNDVIFIDICYFPEKSLFYIKIQMIEAVIIVAFLGAF